jgi:hypothetical protein
MPTRKAAVEFRPWRRTMGTRHRRRSLYPRPRARNPQQNAQAPISGLIMPLNPPSDLGRTCCSVRMGVLPFDLIARQSGKKIHVGGTCPDNARQLVALALYQRSSRLAQRRRRIHSVRPRRAPRKKPRRIVFKEVRNSSVVRIWPNVRHKIKMTFEDRPIETLAQIEAEVFNEGSETIERPTITLTLPEECVVLDLSVTPEELHAQTLIDVRSVTLTMPYLNSVREHGQIVKLSLLANGGTEPVRVSGTGAGWSIRHVPLIDPKKALYRAVGALGFAVALLAFGTFWYIPFIARRLGISENEISWRALAAFSPVAIPEIVSLAVAWRLTNA